MSVGSCRMRGAVQSWLEYPLEMLCWLIFIPLYSFGGLLLLKVIAIQFHGLGGWTFHGLAFFYGLGIVTHGLHIIFFFAVWHTQYYVLTGEFDRILLYPMNPFFMFIVQLFNIAGYIDITPGIVIFVYACLKLNIDWSALTVLKLAAVLAGGTLIRTGIFMISGAIGFFRDTRNSVTMFMVDFLAYNTTAFPLNIYPYALQIALTFLIPVGFINTYPAQDFLGMADTFSIPVNLSVCTLGVGIVFFLLAYGFFRFGLSHYKSTGS
jgi:ABC-2 type transport system permease protein